MEELTWEEWKIIHDALCVYTGCSLTEDHKSKVRKEIIAVKKKVEEYLHG